MRHYFFFLLMLVCASCNEQSVCNESLKGSSISSRKQTEAMFVKAIQGTPLIIPLPVESDPTLFLMPVSNSKHILRVDRLYLVDCLQDEFRFERDIYEIKRIVKVNDSEDSTIKYIAVVSSIANGTFHEYEIDGFMMDQIWDMNKDKFEYKSSIKISIQYDNII